MAVAVIEEETPTGIRPDELSGLDRREKLAVARWMIGKAGWDQGQPFYGRRIRDLSIETRLVLAMDREKDLAWEMREFRRVQESPVYLVEQYGSVQPEEGMPIPFDLWPEQAEALAAMAVELRVIVLKARQLGLTWLALHLAVWLMAFNRLTPRAKILVLSKIGSDAEALVERARKLVARLPGFLRPKESWKYRDSNTRFVLSKGSEMRSLMGTPAAARSFTATMTIFDEFSFYRNGQAADTYSAALPTMGEKGRAVVIFTGNGVAGDGGAAHDLWQKAKRSEGGLVPIFLPDTVNPERRVEGYRERKREEFLTAEAFLAEHPLTEDDAFSSPDVFKVYANVDAAIDVGRELEPYLPELAEEGYEWGIDWGDFQTFAVYAVALPEGGLYVFDELVTAHTEPGKAAEKVIFREPAGIQAPAVYSSADKSPVGTNRTFSEVLREAHNAAPDRFPRKHETVPFGQFKEGGGDKRGGVNTVAYVQHLLDAAKAFDGEPREAAGLLAIAPRCETLAAQLRNLERDAETGKVRKPSLDPRHVERGDHGPDALIAVAAKRAAAWRRRND